jgi:DNA-binding IclR family transcriptional regulator
MIGTGDGACASITERVPCVLDDLAAATRSRARLGVLHDLEVAYIEKQPGYRPVSAFCRSATLPAHPTALGRAMLAFCPADTVDAVIARGLRPYTQHTITSPDRLRQALAVTRLTRVAVTRFELEPGACAVAMPVFGSGGGAVAAIELAVHDLRQELQPVVAALSVASRSLLCELSTPPQTVRAVRPPTAAPRSAPVQHRVRPTAHL